MLVMAGKPVDDTIALLAEHMEEVHLLPPFPPLLPFPPLPSPPPFLLFSRLNILC